MPVGVVDFCGLLVVIDCFGLFLVLKTVFIGFIGWACMVVVILGGMETFNCVDGDGDDFSDTERV